MYMYNDPMHKSVAVRVYNNTCSYRDVNLELLRNFFMVVQYTVGNSLGKY